MRLRLDHQEALEELAALVEWGPAGAVDDAAAALGLDEGDLLAAVGPVLDGFRLWVPPGDEDALDRIVAVWWIAAAVAGALKVTLPERGPVRTRPGCRRSGSRIRRGGACPDRPRVVVTGRELRVSLLVAAGELEREDARALTGWDASEVRASLVELLSYDAPEHLIPESYRDTLEDRAAWAEAMWPRVVHGWLTGAYAVRASAPVALA